MNHKTLAYLIFSGVAVFVLILFYIRIQPIEIDFEAIRQEASEEKLDAPIVTFINPSKGSPNAKLTIVEFSDFECIACGDIQTPLEIVLNTYPDDLRLVWKNLPNDSVHKQATPAAIAAHCAQEQGRFWDYHDMLFKRQTFLSDLQYTEIATDLELNMDKFQSCYASSETLPIIRKDFEEGIALGIAASPILYIGDEILVGAVTLERLLEVVQTQLAVIK